MTDGTRQFPCDQCGANVEFAPGTELLRCPYCGGESRIPVTVGGVRELPYHEHLESDLGLNGETEEVTSVQCTSCAALVEPDPHHEAFPCPYCGSSIVARERSTRQLKPQALLPFLIGREEAKAKFKEWIDSLWFAPDSLKRLAELDGRLKGLYAPYWTYDSRTRSRYSGLRGDNYTVTKRRTVRRDGRLVTETYQDIETRWRPAAGQVFRDFDDVLVVGSESLPGPLAESLEPWDLENIVDYKDEFLSGFTAERYQVDVRRGWERSKQRMEAVIRMDVRRDIGGDHQKIHSLQTRHDGITFKHILLPMWICSYRYREKVYRFLINARTGEIKGQRPWSRVKVAMAIFAGVVVAALLVLVLSRGG